MAVDWNLAGPGFDALQALQIYGAAQQKAVADRKTAAMDTARATAQAKAASGDIAGAAADLIGAGEYQGAAALATLGKTQQEQKGRAAFSSYLRGQGGQPALPQAAPAPLQAAPSAMTGATPPVAADGPQNLLPQAAPPAAAAEGDIVVNAPQRVPAPTLADLAEIGGPELVNQALEYQKAIAGLSKAKVEQLKTEMEAVSTLVPQLLKAPQEQRQAIIDANRDYLNQNGFDDREIEAMDLSDGGLESFRVKGLGLKAATELDETARSHAAAEADRDAARALTARGQDITIRGQNMTDARSRENNTIQYGAIGKQTRVAEMQLRKEFDADKTVAPFKELRPAFQTIRAIATKKNPNPQDDTTLTYNFMKLASADGSAVREGEYALVARGAGLGERVTRALGYADTGQALTPTMRRDLLNAAKTIYTTRRNAYNEKVDQYRGYASDYGLNPDRIGKKYLSPADRKRPAGTISVPGFPGFSIQRAK